MNQLMGAPSSQRFDSRCFLPDDPGAQPPFFSSTSWQAAITSLFSVLSWQANKWTFFPFVFNNIMEFTLIFRPSVFRHPAAKNEITYLFSFTYKFARFLPIAVNSFCFLYILASEGIF
jgi:hypothetical protein